MTRIGCDAYVPPGFMDSGWLPYYCFVEQDLGTVEGITVLKKCIRNTEITSIRDITVVSVDKIPRGKLVVDIDGAYVRMQGW